MSREMEGGCQCGRIRYRARIDSDDAYLCHCRMCQKATGGIAAAFVQLPRGAVIWDTEPEWFASSPIAKRAFCGRCGTPLAFAYRDGTGDIDLTVGSFDTPGGFRPILHAGAESLHESWLDTRALPRHFTASTPGLADRYAAAGLPVPD